MNQPIDYLLFAGEMSADMYGGLLAGHLKALNPDLILWAVGGDALGRRVDRMIPTDVLRHSIGIKGILGTPHWMATIKSILGNTIVRNAIILDFGTIHFKLAALLSHHGIPIHTVITPNFWIWKDVKKARALAAYSQSITAIFEPEYQLYQTFNHPHVYYFGHPMVELSPPLNRQENPQHITFFPGSRTQELRLMLPPMIAIATLLSKALPMYTLAAHVPSPTLLSQIEDMGPLPFQLNSMDKQALLSDTAFLICAGGSATLEGILHQIPMVILGAVPLLTYIVAKYLLRLDVPFIGLPNIMAGKEIVPEWIQFNIKPPEIVASIQTLLEPTQGSSLVAGYTPVVQSLKKTPQPFLELAKTLLQLKP